MAGRGLFLQRKSGKERKRRILSRFSGLLFPNGRENAERKDSFRGFKDKAAEESAAEEFFFKLTEFQNSQMKMKPEILFLGKKETENRERKTLKEKEADLKRLQLFFHCRTPRKTKGKQAIFKKRQS